MYLFLKNIIYVLIFRERGRVGETGREKLVCGCLSQTPPLGTWPATQHLP